MSRHSVWDRDDCHPAWMIIDLPRAESVPCLFEFLGERCGAQTGERCRGSAGSNDTYVAPNGKTIRFMPAHMTRYPCGPVRRPRPHRHALAAR